MNSWKLAVVQMEVAGGRKETNLAHAEALIEQAAAAGAQVLLLPETCDLGWTDPSCKVEAEPVPGGEPCRRFMVAAKRHKVYLCAGLTERDGEEVYNTAVLIGPDGALLTVHRKVVEVPAGMSSYGQGHKLEVVPTPLGVLGVEICFDAAAVGESLTRTLGYMGADVILSPCAWAVSADWDPANNRYGDSWRAQYRAAIRDFEMWIAACSNVGPITGGPWAGRACIGSSIVLDPDGNEVATGPTGVTAETILLVDVQPRARPARAAKWHAYWEEKRSEQPRG